MPSERIVVGMSGGVDSAVAALLLKEQGYDVVGVFMKNWEEKDDEGICTAAADYEDVRRVCDAIGIPYSSVNFTKEYWERVFQIFLSEYAAGRTPNPDILCNKEIKFRAFFGIRAKDGSKKLATGHYARVRRDCDGVKLFKGRRPEQRPDLFSGGHQRGAASGRGLTPWGTLQARAARTRPQGRHPGFRQKGFHGDLLYWRAQLQAFLMQYLPAQPGDIVTPDGKTVGRHDGLMYYTLGPAPRIGDRRRWRGRQVVVVDKGSCQQPADRHPGRNRAPVFGRASRLFAQLVRGRAAQAVF